MLFKIPTPAQNAIIDVVPLEIKGNGRPVGGIDPDTTAILITT